MSRPPRTMVVDTSCWIHFFASGDERVRDLLQAGRAFVHPWVLYELELGSGIPGGDRLLLHRLPRIGAVTDDEAWRVAQPVLGSGLGWVDVHLLAATRSSGFSLMTRDRAFAGAARRLGLRVVA